MAERRLDYCGVASLLGKRAANDLWDLTTPPDIDMDHLPSLEAQARRCEERAAQADKCDVCKEGCRE